MNVTKKSYLLRTLLTIVVLCSLAVAAYAAWKPQIDTWLAESLAARVGLTDVAFSDARIGISQFTASALKSTYSTQSGDIDAKITGVNVQYQLGNRRINDVSVDQAQLILTAIDAADARSGTQITDTRTLNLRELVENLVAPADRGNIREIDIRAPTSGGEIHYRGELNWQTTGTTTVYHLQGASESLEFTVNQDEHSLSTKLFPGSAQEQMLSVDIGKVNEQQSLAGARVDLDALATWWSAAKWIPASYQQQVAQLLEDIELRDGELIINSTIDPSNPTFQYPTELTLLLTDARGAGCQLQSELNTNVSNVEGELIPVSVVGDSYLRFSDCDHAIAPREMMPGLQSIQLNIAEDTQLQVKLANSLPESFEMLGAFSARAELESGHVQVEGDHLVAADIDARSLYPQRLRTTVNVETKLKALSVPAVAFDDLAATGRWEIELQADQLVLSVLEEQTLDISGLTRVATTAVSDRAGAHTVSTTVSIAPKTKITAQLKTDGFDDVNVDGQQTVYIRHALADNAKLSLQNWKISNWTFDDALPEIIDIPFRVDANIPVVKFNGATLNDSQLTLNAHLQAQAPAPLQLSILPDSILNVQSVKAVQSDPANAIVSQPISLELGGDFAYDTLKDGPHKVSGNAVARILAVRAQTADGDSLFDVEKIMVGAQIKDLGEAPQLALRYTAERLVVPSVVLQTTQIHGHSNVDLSTFSFDGVTVISGIRQDDWPADIESIALRAEISGNPERYSVTGNINIAPGLDAVITADSEQNRAIAEIDTSTRELVDWLRPLASPSVKGLEIESGSTRIRDVWNIDDMNSLLVMQTENLTGSYEDIDFTEGQIRIEVTDPIKRTARFDVTIAEGRFANDMTFTTLRTTGGLSPESLSIRRASVQLLGGGLSVENVLTPLDDLSGTVPIMVDDISLGKLVGYFGRDDINASGKLSGTIPINIQDGNISIEDGKLTSSGGGTISYRPDPSVVPADIDNIALKALDNFEFDELSVAINYQHTGDYAVRLRLEGRNQALYDGYPIAFNVNLKGNLPGLVQASLIGGRFEEQIFDQLRNEPANTQTNNDATE